MPTHLKRCGHGSMEELVVLYILFLTLAACVVVGLVANVRGRSGVAWFFISLIATPVIAYAAVMGMPRSTHNPGLLDGRPLN